MPIRTPPRQRRPPPRLRPQLLQRLPQLSQALTLPPPPSLPRARRSTDALGGGTGTLGVGEAKGEAEEETVEEMAEETSGRSSGVARGVPGAGATLTAFSK